MFSAFILHPLSFILSTWLGKEDSNLHYLIQSQACYHCTIPHDFDEYRGAADESQGSFALARPQFPGNSKGI